MEFEAFIDALATGNVTAVRAHLEERPGDLRLTTVDKGGLPHIAARAGQWEMLKALESLGADMGCLDEGEDERYAGAETVFHAAAQCPHADPDFLPLLLRRYRHLIDIDALNDEGHSALYQALARDRPPNARALVLAGARLPPKPWPPTAASEWLETWSSDVLTEGERYDTMPAPTALHRASRF